MSVKSCTLCRPKSATPTGRASSGSTRSLPTPATCSNARFAAVQSAACRVSNAPGAALEHAGACADALVDAVAVLPTTRERETKAFEDQLELQTEAFEESQRERAGEFQGAVETFRAELDRTHAQACDDIEQRVAEIKRLEVEAATLVERIALIGTAELYRRQGRRQRLLAELLRAATVLAMLGAVAVALTTARVDPAAESLLASVLAAVLLVVLAAYLARESGRHRAREEHATVQLEFAAADAATETPAPAEPEEDRAGVAVLSGAGSAATGNAPA